MCIGREWQARRFPTRDRKARDASEPKLSRMLSHILRELILPPSLLMILLAVSFALRRRKPRWAAGLFLLAWGLFYLLSIPLVAYALTLSGEGRPALPLQRVREFQAHAIVVLGAGTDFDAIEYDGRSVPSAFSLKRIAYAAYLASALKLPVLTTGGYGESPDDAEGRTAAWQLEQGGVRDVLVEAESRNTRENALLSKRVAETRGIERVVLVTQASHAARAEAVFVKAGFQTLVAPTGFRAWQPWERGILLVIPTHSHFDESCGALRAHLALLHEWLRG